MVLPAGLVFESDFALFFLIDLFAFWAHALSLFSPMVLVLGVK
jgi:hypothetical protein